MKKLFVITLILLMIFLIFSNYTASRVEGMTSGSSNTFLTETTVSQYNSSKKVFKLYDNLYYDSTNGNLIELVTDSSDNVILNIFPRTVDTSNPTYTTYTTTSTASQNTTESILSDISPSTTAWTYKSESKYQITVIPYLRETYMHIMDIRTQDPTIILSAFFTDPKGDNLSDYYTWVTPSDVSDGGSGTVGQKLGVSSGSYSGTSNTADKTNVVETYYDNKKSLYQISQYVKYDPANGNMCVEGRDAAGSKNITVYSRTGLPTVYDASNNATTLGGSTTSSNVSSLVTTTHTPILIKEPISPMIVIYWPVYAKTIIVEYKGVLDTSNNGLALVNVTLYKNSERQTTAPATAATSTTSSSSGSDSTPSMSDMMKMMWLWKNIGGDAAASSNYQLSDYVPKTSIVPPVCPACPSCPGVSCPSCGGASGASSGTAAPAGAASDTNVNAPHEAAGGLIDKTGTAIGHGIASTGRFVGEGVKDTASFAKSGIEGTASFAKSAITETAESAEGAAKYVGTGVGNFLGRLTSGGAGAGAGAGIGGSAVGTNAVSGASGAAPVGYTGTVTNGAAPGGYKPDVYSYGGSMPSQYQAQGGLQNIQPLIADFSKFGR